MEPLDARATGDSPCVCGGPDRTGRPSVRIPTAETSHPSSAHRRGLSSLIFLPLHPDIPVKFLRPAISMRRNCALSTHLFSPVQRNENTMPVLDGQRLYARRKHFISS